VYYICILYDNITVSGVVPSGWSGVEDAVGFVGKCVDWLTN